ncbi:MAG: hypothetical protein GY710_15650 [Desulfobacteraceae bacterium]|nr:hypothetical protein [Desulfobacteraceae bacterium]
MDFTGINWILGPFAIISGIYWIGLNIKVSKRKKKEKKPKSVNNLICPKCKQAYPIEEDKSLKKCPKCQIDMLTLEEFLKYIK